MSGASHRSVLIACVLLTGLLMLTACESLHIWQAAQLGKQHEVDHLLDENPNLVNARDENGWTPLMHAVSGQHERIVKMLLERGADPRIKAGSNWDALHEARKHDSGRIVKMIEDAIDVANKNAEKGGA